MIWFEMFDLNCVREIGGFCLAVCLIYGGFAGFGFDCLFCFLVVYACNLLVLIAFGFYSLVFLCTKF